MRIRIVLLAALGALAAVGASSAAPATTRLDGTVGPNFKITLNSATGVKVKTLRAGLYSITVKDLSPIHSFVMEGPGVEREITGVSFTGTKTVTVKLRKGKYKVYCRPHESSMFQFVAVS